MNLTGSQAPTENGPRMVLTEVVNVNGPATSLPSSIAPPGSGSPHEESLFRLDKTNKWEDFNSDEEKRGTHTFFRAPDKSVLENYFLYFSSKTYVVGSQKNRLNEMVLLGTQNTCLN